MNQPLTDQRCPAGVRAGGTRASDRDNPRSTERLQRTVRAMEYIARAVVRTAEGPRALVEEVARVAAEHLQATWMVIALADDALDGARPRFVVRDPEGRIHDRVGDLPAGPRRELERLRTARAGSPEDAGSWVRVPMPLDGTVVGGLAGLPGPGQDLEVADLSVLRILAGQCATAMHTSALYRTGVEEQRRAQLLLDEVGRQAEALAARTDQLRTAEQRLRVADQRELLDNERRRIALELHDSVAQTVLTAGLLVDVLRGEAAALDGGRSLASELDRAKGLMVTATEQLRSAIYALNHPRPAGDVAGLPDLLAEVAAQHRPHLAVTVRVEGRAVALGAAIDHALARTAGEALFNVAMHSDASRASVRLRYLDRAVTLRISDDGHGDPAALRRTVRLARRSAADGRHRGLVGMAQRAERLGGSLSIRRSRAGGICIESTIPMAADTPRRQEAPT